MQTNDKSANLKLIS